MTKLRLKSLGSNMKIRKENNISHIIRYTETRAIFYSLVSSSWRSDKAQSWNVSQTKGRRGGSKERGVTCNFFTEWYIILLVYNQHELLLEKSVNVKVSQKLSVTSLSFLLTQWTGWFWFCSFRMMLFQANPTFLRVGQPSVTCDR